MFQHKVCIHMHKYAQLTAYLNPPFKTAVSINVVRLIGILTLLMEIV